MRRCLRCGRPCADRAVALERVETYGRPSKPGEVYTLEGEVRVCERCAEWLMRHVRWHCKMYRSDPSEGVGEEER